jgi:two-component system, LytTR family, response regulator
VSSFRVLVVDDEPLAREVAVGVLRRDPDISSIEECENGLRAKEIITRTRPDIVFLDIEMPGLTGVQLAEDLQNEQPVIVFTTAFSQYAMDAFDVAATDYILKPFSDERFLEALGRAKRRVRERRLSQLAGQMAHVAAELQHGEPGDQSGPVARYMQRMSLKHGDGTIVLRMDEIVWIEAQDYCVMVHSTRGNHLIRGSLNALEEQLDPDWFVRAHRTAIVSLQHVRETHDRDGLRLVLSNGATVPVSRSRKPHVEARLSPRLR